MLGLVGNRQLFTVLFGCRKWAGAACSGVLAVAFASWGIAHLFCELRNYHAWRFGAAEADP